MIYDITPCPKPRITHQGRFSPAAKKYYAFAEECRLKKVGLGSEGCHVIFHIPMPKSWSKRKKKTREGYFHQQRPDIDNYAKALFDALFKDDSCIADIHLTKRWAEKGAIEIT